jgi:hypothetical protein
MEGRRIGKWQKLDLNQVSLILTPSKLFIDKTHLEARHGGTHLSFQQATLNVQSTSACDEKLTSKLLEILFVTPIFQSMGRNNPFMLC